MNVLAKGKVFGRCQVPTEPGSVLLLFSCDLQEANRKNATCFVAKGKIVLRSARRAYAAAHISNRVVFGTDATAFMPCLRFSALIAPRLPVADVARLCVKTNQSLFCQREPTADLVVVAINIPVKPDRYR